MRINGNLNYVLTFSPTLSILRPLYIISVKSKVHLNALTQPKIHYF